MKKLHKKIQSWSKNYNTSSNQKIFEYCDSILLKFLWNWARKTHPNKSKGWIRKKYFHFIYSHKWFFGKKIGTIFICLPLHSQTNFK
jgi:RNA-directed DNA polymerase